MGVMKALGAQKRKKKPPFGAIELTTVEGSSWQLLNLMEAHVYNTLKSFYRGNDEPFKAPYDAMKRRSRIRHGETLKNALNGLRDKGWIEIERFAKHGKGRGLRVKATKYKLTFKYDLKRF